jgi:hypothetical protein
LYRDTSSLGGSGEAQNDEMGYLTHDLGGYHAAWCLQKEGSATATTATTTTGCPDRIFDGQP